MRKLLLAILFMSSVAQAAYSPKTIITDPATPANQASVSAGGALKVDGSGATQPVSSTQLPASLGQKTMANSMSCALSSDQSAVPVSGTFWQATQPTSIADGSAVTTGSKADSAATDSTSSWSVIALLKGLWAKLAAISGQLPAALDGSGFLKVHEQGTPKAAVNASASASQNSSITTTASTLSAPANTVGFQLSNDSVSTDCVRYRIGAVATSSAGIQLYPTDVTPVIPSGSNISVASCSGTQTVNVQWISQ